MTSYITIYITILVTTVAVAAHLWGATAGLLAGGLVLLNSALATAVSRRARSERP